MIKVDKEKIVLRGRPEELAAELLLLIAYCQSNKQIDISFKKLGEALRKAFESDDTTHFPA